MHGVSDPLPVPISAQVTYGSADGTGSGGGWQVRQVVGAADQETVSALSLRMATTLEPVFPMPEYPVDGLPRRMLITTVGPEDQRVAVWHSNPAGRDASGRPGNVFTHCALLAPGASRPTLLWACPQWQTPFGAKDVAGVSLPSRAALDAVSPFPALSDFIFDPDHWRIGTLAVILDAVQRALSDGSVVVLVVDDHVEAARWITAVSLCTDGRTAQRIHSSTYERARDAENWRSLGLHLVGVPRTDHEAIRLKSSTGRILVIDTAEEVDLGDWRGVPHRTADASIEVTPWSSLVLAACSTGENLIELADSLDTVRADLPDDVWQPAWPLALLSWDPGEPDPAAAQVLAESTPARAADIPGFYATVSAALGHLLGQDQSSRMAALNSMIAGGSSGLMVSLAAGEVVAGAIADPHWLASHGAELRLPAGVRPQLTQRLYDTVMGGLSEVVAEPIDGPRQASVAMRVIDLLDAVDWRPKSIEGRLIALSDDLADYCTRGDPGMEQVVVDAGAASRDYLRDALTVGYRRGRVSPATLELLGCVTTNFLSGPQALVEGEVPLLAAEAAELAERKGGDLELVGRAQYLMARRAAQSGLSNPIFEQPVAISAKEIADLVRSYPGRVAVGLVAQVFANYLDRPELAIVQQALQTHEPHLDATLDSLRVLNNPVDAALGLMAYRGHVLNLVDVIAAGDVTPPLVIPSRIKVRCQAISLVHVIARSTLVPTFVDTDLPSPSEADLIELGALLVGSRPLSDPQTALEAIARWGRDSPALAARLPQWAQMAPARSEEPVLDQILAAGIRQARPLLDGETVKQWAEARFPEQPVGKFVSKWLNAHGLSGSKWPGWLKLGREKQPEET